LKPDASLRDKVDAVYATLPGCFPGHWEKWYGEDDSTGVWGEALSSLSGDQVMAGLRELCRMPTDFAPTPGGFHTVCKAAWSAHLAQQKRDEDERVNAAHRAKVTPIDKKETWVGWANTRYCGRCLQGALSGITGKKPCPDETGDLQRVVDNCALPPADADSSFAHAPYWAHMRAEVLRIFF
jgi:hypothetical protein